MDLYPSIDLRGGRVVQLQQGDYDARDRTTTTIRSRSRGGSRRAASRWIHVVDLDAARDGGDANLGVIEAICANVSVRVQTGGGVRSVEDASDRFSAGVHPRRDRQRRGRAPGARRRARDACIRAGSRSGSTPGAATSRFTAGPSRPAPTLVALAQRFDRARRRPRSSSPRSTATACSQGPDLEQLRVGARPRPRCRSSRAAASASLADLRDLAAHGGRRSAAARARSRAPRSTRAASPSPRGSPRARRPRDPVPRCRRRPRREGRAVRRDPRRRRSGRARGALRRRGRRRARVPRHHRVVGRPRHDGARRRARRRPGVHPVHGRRRHPHASKTCGGCCAPAPTRCR